VNNRNFGELHTTCVGKIPRGRFDTSSLADEDEV